MYYPYPAYWYVGLGRPRPPVARLAMLGLPAGPVLGGLGTGAGFIEPGLGFFARGNPVGGPSEGFRGVSAAAFPAPAIIFGPGAPLAAEWTGLAGSRLGNPPGIRGEPFR